MIVTSSIESTGSLLDARLRHYIYLAHFLSGKMPMLNLCDEPSLGVRWGRRSITTNLNMTLVQSEPHLNPGALKQTRGHRHPESSEYSGSESKPGPLVFMQPSGAPNQRGFSYLNVCLTAFIRRSIIFSRSSREQLRSSVLSGFKSRAVIFPNSSISRMIVSDLPKRWKV